MIKYCIPLKLIIGAFLLLSSGCLIGCGTGELFHQEGIGVEIGLGIAMLILSLLLIRIYNNERLFEKRKEIYKKH